MSPYISVTFFFSIAITLLTSCTSLKQKTTFVALNQQERSVSVFEVNIESTSKLAKVRYRAGFRDADAVDQVFKDVTIPPSIQEFENLQTIKSAEQSIMGELTSQMQTAYQEGDYVTTELLFHQMTRAQSLERRLRYSLTSAVPEAPAEKFVVAYSADPDEVFQAITDAALGQQAQQNLLLTIKAISDSRSQPISSAEINLLWDELVEKPNTMSALPDNISPANIHEHRNQLLSYIQHLKDFQEAIR